jgi:autotransporter-associated beta strand protein
VVSINEDTNLGAENGLLAMGTDTGINDTAGTLQTTGTFTSNRPVALNQGGGIFDTAAGVNLTGRITGTGSLTKKGIGPLSLSGNNGYSGGTNINIGTLLTAEEDTLPQNGPITVALGATLDLAGNNQTIGSLAGDGEVTLGTATLTTGDDTDTSFTGVISGQGGSLHKVGTGTFTLSGANTYTGGTSIEQGTLQTAEEGTLPTEGPVTLAASATLDLAGNNQTISSLAGDGKVTLGTATLKTGDDTDTSFTGVISGQGGGLHKLGTGTFTLSGTNTYTGGTSIEQGTLRTDSGDTLPQNGPITVALGATLDLADTNQTIGSLAGDGEVELGGASLTTGGDNTSTKFEGVISGEGKLIKKGTEIFTLSAANTYTGGTSIEQGTLQTAEEGTLPTEGPVSVQQDATLDLAGNNQTIGSLAGDGKVTLGTAALTTGDDTDTSFTGVISGQGGGLHKLGTDTFTFSGLNEYTGGTFVEQGTLLTGNGDTLPTEGPVTLATGAILDLADTNQTISSLAGDGKVTLGTATLKTGDDTDTSFTGVISGQGGVLKLGTGTFTLSGANTYTDGTSIEQGTLQTVEEGTLPTEGPVSVQQDATLDLAGNNQTIGSLAGDGKVTLGTATLTTGDDTDTSFTGVISGQGGGLHKLGTGTFTLSAANTYTGGTSIEQGTLIGDTNSLPGDIDNNGTLIFKQGFDQAYAGVMSGSGIFRKQGNSALALTGQHTSTGPTFVDEGSLAMNFIQQPDAGSVTIGSGTTLSGTGTIQSVSNNGGTLSPGDASSFGTGFESLTVNTYQSNGGTMAFRIDSAGNNSKLLSDGGTFELSHTNLSLLAVGSLNELDRSKHYELIRVNNTTLDAIQGPFQSIPARVGKFVPEMIYNADTVELSFNLIQTDLASRTTSLNDRSVAGYLDHLSGIIDGPLEDFIFSLEGKSVGELDDALSQLDPAAPGTMVESLNVGSLVNAMTQGRMSNLAAGGQISNAGAAAFTSGSSQGRLSLAASLSPGHGSDRPTHTRASLSQDQSGYQAFCGKGKGGVWAQGFALNHQQKTHKDIAGFGADSGGLLAGIDTPFLTPNLYIGAAVGYGRGDVHYKQGRGTDKITSHLASVYTLYATDAYYVDASLALGMNTYRNNRRIAVIGKTAQSRHRGTEWAHGNCTEKPVA